MNHLESDLCSLVLKPHLHNPYCEPGLSGQCLSHLQENIFHSSVLKIQTLQCHNQLDRNYYMDRYARTITFVSQGSIFWHTFPLIRQSGPPTLRQGLADTSKEALKARRCCVVKMVRGRFERLCSFPSSPPLPPPEPPPPSSSSLFTGKVSRQQNSQPLQEGTFILR